MGEGHVRDGVGQPLDGLDELLLDGAKMLDQLRRRGTIGVRLFDARSDRYAQGGDDLLVVTPERRQRVEGQLLLLLLLRRSARQGVQQRCAQRVHIRRRTYIRLVVEFLRACVLE